MKKKNCFSYQNLSVSRSDKRLLKGVTWQLTGGHLYLLMGPNGAGKSSLAQSTIGAPNYAITQGSLSWNGETINTDSMAERAQKGIFLSWQQPMGLPVRMVHFLKAIWEKTHPVANTGNRPNTAALLKKIKDYMALLKLPERMLYENLYENASGGERKRGELLQALLLNPQMVIFDEIDSGMDQEGMQMIQSIIQRFLLAGSVVLLITHHTAAWHQLPIKQVAVLQKGALTHLGPKALLDQVASSGYAGLPQTFALP